MNDICPRNRAFFHFKRFASRCKLVRTEKFLIERWKPIRKKDAFNFIIFIFSYIDYYFSKKNIVSVIKMQ